MFRRPVITLARSSVRRNHLLLHPIKQNQLVGLGLPRNIHQSALLLNAPRWPQDPIPQNPVAPSDDLGSSGGQRKPSHESFIHEWVHSPGFQAALTTIVGLAMVFAGGIGYLKWYKGHQLSRMEDAFKGGYDPALEISSSSTPSFHFNRREQPVVDAIFQGKERGGYYLIIGPKGTGKNTMILDAMRQVRAEGASVCEAHPDLEVFRLRVGAAIDFDFYEDYQGGLFSRADPRQGGPELDIERALKKLEKVAIKYSRKNGRPLVMAFTNVHLFPNNEDGHSILRQLQQRAEAWGEAGIMTMVFTADDFWVLDRMKKMANRMRILSVYDLSAADSMEALRKLRRHNLAWQKGVKAEDIEIESDAILRRCYEMVGGRTSFLARVAGAPNMIEEAETMVELEKGWLLSKIGLIPEMDDDVMDEQKWASCSWLLLRHLAGETPELDPPLGTQELPESTPGEIDMTPSVIDKLTIPGLANSGDVTVAEAVSNADVLEEEDKVLSAAAAGALVIPDDDEAGPKSEDIDIELPKVTFDEARRLMTRTDFFEGLDYDNIISMDVHHYVRPDNMLILRAAQSVVAQEGFDDMLDQTRDRVDEIEGLHRQSELTVKEPLRAMWSIGADGRTVVEVVGLGGSFVPAENEDEDGDDDESGRVQDDKESGDTGTAGVNWANKRLV